MSRAPYAFAAFVTGLVLVAIPVSAQEIDLAGMWSAKMGNFEELPLRGDPGVEVGEYVGVPLNAAARQHAQSWMPTIHSLPEWQGRPHPVTYSMRAPQPNFRMGTIVDPGSEQLIAYTVTGLFGRADRTIWMDGRPHPSKYAEHTRSGFTTGRWEGNTLVAYTTHMQAGFLRKTGAPSSDQATLTTRFSRHGDVLTVLAIIEDPIYLAEPWLLSKSFQVSPTPISPIGPPCVTAYEANVTTVPHYAPDKNPFVDEMTMKYGVPREAAIGVPETLYPEYRKKLKTGPNK